MTDPTPPIARGPRPVDRVVIVMAMEEEAAPLRQALGADDVSSPQWAAALPARIAVAPATSTRPEVVLAVNGTDPITGVACIGTTAAAMTTQVALHLPDRAAPDLILSVGTAGGWRRAGAAVGDTYLAWPRFSCHDRRIDLAGFQAYADGHLPAADLRAHADALGCRLGAVTTGDSLDESPIDGERILANGAEVKDMEAVAVAWVAHLHGLPVGAVKSITDLVDTDQPTPEQFLLNLTAAADAVRQATVGLLERLATTGLE